MERTTLVAQTVKHLPAMQEIWVRSLGQEYPLEKEMATHSSIPAWKIPWTEEPGGLSSMGSQRVRHNWARHTSGTLLRPQEAGRVDLGCTPHQLPGLVHTHVHGVGDAIQPLLPSSPPALNLSQHQGLFQGVGSLHQVAEVLEFQLQHQSF